MKALPPAFVRPTVLLLAGIAGLLAPGPMASAQTVESAQTFLARLAEQGSSRVYREWPYVWYGRNMAGQNCDSGCHYKTTRAVRLTSANSPSRCVTTLGHDAPAGFQNGDFWHAPTAQPTSAVVDWSKVTAVRNDEGYPSVHIVGLDGRDGINTLYLNFDTEELAVRATAAMEFLRTSCDSLGGTGF